MTPFKKYFLLIVFACLCALGLNAQALVKAYVDRDKILVGEPIQLTVEARFPLGETVKWFEVDSLPHFEWIAKESPKDTNDVDGKMRVQSLSITSYDTGKWTIPAFTITIGNKQYSSDTLSVEVKYSDGFNADEAYHEIKETEEVKLPFDKTKLYYILGGVLLLALVLILYFLFRKKAKKAPVVSKPLSAFESAMKEIQSLRSHKPAGAAETKAYYTSLNDILRNYLAEQWGLSTKDKTNEELILQLKRYRLSEEQFNSLAQCLRLSDFVKFAKYLPAETDNEKALQVTETAIIQLHKSADNLAV